MNTLKVVLFNTIVGLIFYSCIGPEDNTSVGNKTNNQKEVWYLKTNDENIKLFVKEFGIGDTVVVVHGGFGAEHSYLVKPFTKLKNDYHFIFYDQRGSLRSPAPDSLISVDKHIEDLETLRDELNISKLNLVGHSMGTFLCSAYLNKYPDNVKRLTLLALTMPKTPDSEEEKKLYGEQQKAAFEFFERPEVDHERKKHNLFKDSLTDKEATLKWKIGFAAVNIFDLSKWRQVKGGGAFYNQEAGTAAGKSMPNKKGWNFFEDYENTSIPITVINGSHDFSDMGGLMYKDRLKSISNVEYVLINKAGHSVWIDYPEIFNKNLKHALSRKLIIK